MEPVDARHLLFVILYLPRVGCTSVDCNWTLDVCKEAGWRIVTVVVDDCMIGDDEESGWRDVTVCGFMISFCLQRLWHCRSMQHCFSFPMPPFFFLSLQKQQLPHSGLLQPTHWPHLLLLPKLAGLLFAFVAWNTGSW